MKTIIVDDEPLLISSFKRLVKDFREIELVGEFRSGQKALDYMEKNPVDLACLDIIMPVMSGIELAKRIREKYPDVLIAFVTAYEEYIKQSNEIGTDYYVIKPYTSETIGLMVNHMKRLSAASWEADEMPYGVIRCTNENYPRITYVNGAMLSMLGMDSESTEWKDYIRNNVYFAVPMRDRDRFRGCLDAARLSSSPLSIEHRLIRADGREISVTGWVRTVGADGGKKEFDIMYMPAASGIHTGNIREKSYIEALKNAYAAVFEFDLDAKTVTCIHDRTSRITKEIPKVCATYDSAKKHCLENYISGESRESFSRLIDCYIYSDGLIDEQTNNFTTTIRVTDNRTARIECQIIKLSRSMLLLCCRLANQSALIETAGGALEAGKGILRERNKGMYIRTFGYFDVFVDGEPVLFRYRKAKELLAVLVDRRGGFVSGNYAISCLWEDESYNPTIRARYRQTAARLSAILKKYGLEDIVESVGGQRRIVAEKVRCDLFDYYAGVDLKEAGFKGSYMLDYSWAEVTQADLSGGMEQ